MFHLNFLNLSAPSLGQAFRAFVVRNRPISYSSIVNFGLRNYGTLSAILHYEVSESHAARRRDIPLSCSINGFHVSPGDD